MALSLVIAGCQRGARLPEKSGVGGLLMFEYSGITVMHQYSGRDYVHLRFHFGWQNPEKYSYATQRLAVEGAFVGGAKGLTADAFASSVEAAGATLDFAAGSDGPVVMANCLKDHLDEAWALLVRCFSLPTFEKEAYQQMRDSRIATQRALESDLAHLASQAAIREAWPVLDPMKTMGGSSTDLEVVEHTTAQAAFMEMMRSKCNLRLVTVGPVDAERISDLLLDLVEVLPDGTCAGPPATTAAPQLQRARLIHKPHGGDFIAGIFPGPPRGSVASVNMGLVMHMVEKRLHDHLVVRDRLASGALAQYIHADPAYNLIQIKGRNALQCAEFTLSELRKLKADGFSNVEVELGKRALGARIDLNYEAAPSLAAILDVTAAWNSPTISGNERLILDKSGAKALSALLRTYLTGITWGIVGDTTGIDRKSLQRL
ncbi:MAG: Peptidase inactive domain [Bacteroidota bacterium]